MTLARACLVGLSWLLIPLVAYPADQIFPHARLVSSVPSTGTSTHYIGIGHPFPIGSVLVFTIPNFAHGSGGTAGHVATSSSSSRFDPGANQAPGLGGTGAGGGANGNAGHNGGGGGAGQTGLARGNKGTGSAPNETGRSNGVTNVSSPHSMHSSPLGTLTGLSLATSLGQSNIIHPIGETRLGAHESEATGGGIASAAVEVSEKISGIISHVGEDRNAGTLESASGPAGANAGYGTIGATPLAGNDGNSHAGGFNGTTGGTLGEILKALGDIASPAPVPAFSSGGLGGNPGTPFSPSGSHDIGWEVGPIGTLEVISLSNPEPPSVLIFGIGGLAMLTALRRRKYVLAIPSRN